MPSSEHVANLASVGEKLRYVEWEGEKGGREGGRELRRHYDSCTNHNFSSQQFLNVYIRIGEWKQANLIGIYATNNLSVYVYSPNTTWLRTAQKLTIVYE